MEALIKQIDCVKEKEAQQNKKMRTAQNQ